MDTRQGYQGESFPLRTPKLKAKHIVNYLLNNIYIILIVS